VAKLQPTPKKKVAKVAPVGVLCTCCKVHNTKRKAI
jgi:hypothetical protein